LWLKFAFERKIFMHPTGAPVKDVLVRLCCIMLAAGALLPLAYFLPRFDLTGPVAQAAYWTAESGSRYGIPVIGVGMICVLLGRSGLSWRQRGAELLVILLALALLFGGAAYVNEFVVKRFFAVPRPNIRELASMPPEAPVLKMSADQFYDMPTKALRSEHRWTNTSVAIGLLKPDIPFPRGIPFRRCCSPRFFWLWHSVCFRGSGFGSFTSWSAGR
jgi:hypothetical protein